ncbi:MAG: Gfo/Idh/MocA family oxidoreductase [Anaerolineae bacterium]|nr:Gfo/Idh/MocA family oxidoreductase [Anaerolineae bacterium]
MAQDVKVGIIGCGNISGQYLQGCRTFDMLDLVSCADLDQAKAETVAEANGLRAYPSPQALLDDPDLDIVINLTIPAVHAEVSLLIIAAGKHPYSEKPLAISRADGQAILKAAQKRGVRVGCAPDTFLGGGLQTCRKLIDEGQIGQPVGATAFMMSAGPERWHPNPGFFYQTGAGPMFDMGPYYLTALIHLLGPVERGAGATPHSFGERGANNQAPQGEHIPVEVPTYVTGLLNFQSGPIATLVTTFDGWYTNVPNIEIYGSEGTLHVPDPNHFQGPVRLRRAGDDQWLEVPLTHAFDMRRGIGVADLAYGLVYDRPHRPSGELAYHVLDVMHAIEDSSQTGRHIAIESRCERPAALPLGLEPGQLDR